MVMYKILIVDDERNERMGIEKLIKRYQYQLEVTQAANGPEALEILAKEEIDILLTDIKMPFMTGIQLIKEVHKRGWNPLCIIYSAYGEFEYAQDAIALGVLQYLLKPIKLKEFQELFDKIIAACDEKKKQQEENEALKIQREHVENDRINRSVLSYLESETEEIEAEAEELFADGNLVPAVISSYSYLFTKYWENYENDISTIVGENPAIINKDDNQTLVLIRQTAAQPKQRRRAAKICESLIELSREKYQSEVFIVVGAACRNMRELKHEYEKMREQLEYQFFISESTYFLEGEGEFVKQNGDMLSLYFEKIVTCAKMEDFRGMKKEFGKAFEYVEKNVGLSPVYVKYNFSEILKKCCDNLHKSDRLIEVVEEIYESRTISQVKSAVFRLLDALDDGGREEKTDHRVIWLAKEYIQKHYQDYTLNVSSIAYELGISTPYLSALFKCETGKNLVKYISQYRLEMAKELLATTNMKVGEIAEKVGYLNTSYFISVFKNTTGCSPAKYREKEFHGE